MTETRDCTFKNDRDQDEKGMFLRWGDSYYRDNGNNPLPFTVAIIETANGQVEEVPPHNVKFTMRERKPLSYESVS